MELREQNGKVYIGKFSFEEIAEKYGTPFYLYDLDTIKQKIRDVREAFGDTVSLYYAMKANPNVEILKAIREDVDGLDISSKGEMEIALKAGYRPEQLSFAGPGKTRDELTEAVTQGVGIISVESMRELRDLRDISLKEGTKANVCIRINPKLLIKDFAVKMGGKATQFGIDEEELPEALDYLQEYPETFNVLGIHVYSGTQCLSEDALGNNLLNTLEIASTLYREKGFECGVINLGGGFGVSLYGEGKKLDLGKVADRVKDAFTAYNSLVRKKIKFIFELGRYLVAEAGIYVTCIVSEKLSRGEQFYVLDGGMNHHLAASGNLGATLRKNYVVRNLSRPLSEKKACHLVGPLCTPLDLMGRNVSVETPQIGDLVGFLTSGSYSLSASPLFFLGHGFPVELMVSETDMKLINAMEKT